MSQSGATLKVIVTDGVPSPLILTLAQHVAAGTLLRVRGSGVAMLRGLRVVEVRASAVGGCGAPVGHGETALPLVHRFSWAEMQHDWMWHIQTLSMAVVEAPCDLPKGSRVCLHCQASGSAAGAEVANAVAGLTWQLCLGKVASPEAVEFACVTAPVTLHFAPGPVDHLEAALRFDGEVLVQQFDAFGNPTRPEPGDYLQVVAGAESTRVPSSNDVAATRVTLRASEMMGGNSRSDDGASRVCVVDSAGRAATSNALPVAMDGTPLYFGEFHWHTDFSGDGQRSLGAALTSARDELGLDFAGPADHLSPDGTYLQRLPIEQAEISRHYDEPGRFCILPGAELSGRYGHANLYAADFDTFMTIIRRFPHELLPVWREDPDRYPLELLAALCPEGKAMIVPHHTNTNSSVSEGVVRDDGRPFWCAMHWPLVTPLLRQGLRLVEIVQNRGSFETEEPDPVWHVRWGRFGGSVQTALLRGHRVGFIGGTDNHTGWPTRRSGEPGYGGLTAVQASNLDTQSLFEALYRRRCYATSGARIVADATLNGCPMGSELRLAPGAPRVFEIQVHGTAPLVAAQVVSMGAVLADLPVDADTWDFEATWQDDRPGRPLEDVSYYVRVRQADGHCAWLSPWWVDMVEG